VYKLHRTRKNRSDDQQPRQRHPLLVRTLSDKLSSTWITVRSLHHHPKIQPLKATSRKLIGTLNGKDWASIATTIIVSLLYTAFFTVYIYSFAVYFLDLAWFQKYVDAKSWSFGQVVAISVWTQPICEYIHLEIRKSSPPRGIVFDPLHLPLPTNRP